MITIRRKINTAFKVWQKNGWSGIKNRLRFNYSVWRRKNAYQKWIRAFDTLTDETRENLRRETENFSHKPLISVVLPVYNVEEKWLRLCIESVRKQIYKNWELCIADDCSPSPHIRRILEEYAKKDERIKVIFRKENGHISAASNSALELATGEFCVLLDHDDELSEHALFYVAKEINDFPETEMIYSDEDLLSENGKRSKPKFKPDFSRDLFYSLNLITHLSAYKTEVLRKIGGFTVGLEGSQDYDLGLRVIEQIPERHIRHIPKVLYYWRVIKGSVALSGDEKPYAHEAARNAIRAHLERIGKKATVEPTVHNLHRVRYRLPQKLPKVNLILIADENFEFTESAVETFVQNTNYTNLEIVLICSRNLKKKFENKLKFQNLKLILCDGQNEAEKYNLAVAETDGKILCFVDINIKPQSKDWLLEMVSFAIQKEIGAVGAKLLFADDCILHAGLVIGIGGAVGIAHYKRPNNEGEVIARMQYTGNFSAVSVSCLAVRRELFKKNGGFDAANFPNKFFDVDFCLKLSEENLRNIFTPYAELVLVKRSKKTNIQKKADDQERKNFRRKWRKFIEKDPFYNPNLSLRQNESFCVDIHKESN